MSLVTMVSGGLDSTLMSIMAKEEGVKIFPLFIDYGQLCAAREWKACVALHKKHRLPKPVKMDLSGYGHVIQSGLTNPKKRINEDAFLPGRNLLFLVAGAGYAHQVKASGVALGLLNDQARLFPDQSAAFLSKAEQVIEEALGYRVAVVAPLIGMCKADVMKLAQDRRLAGTYSCHAGSKLPCGVCVSCAEAKAARASIDGG